MHTDLAEASSIACRSINSWHEYTFINHVLADSEFAFSVYIYIYACMHVCTYMAYICMHVLYRLTWPKLSAGSGAGICMQDRSRRPGPKRASEQGFNL